MTPSNGNDGACAQGICGRSSVQGSPDSRQTPGSTDLIGEQLRPTPLNGSDSSVAGDDDPRRGAPQREDRTPCAGCSRVPWPCLLAGRDVRLGHSGGVSRGSPRRQFFAGRRQRPRPRMPKPFWSMGSTWNGSRNWAAAIETYHTALERWPSRVDFRRRLRLCEIHFKLTRRYVDTSFRNILLRLPHEQAVDLYDEVLERIQTNYVDPVPLEPLGPPRTRQPRSGPARPGLRQDQRAGGHARACELAARRAPTVPGSS